MIKTNMLIHKSLSWDFKMIALGSCQLAKIFNLINKFLKETLINIVWIN